MFGGEPMWKSFLDEVDTILIAALSEEEWRRIRAIAPQIPNKVPAARRELPCSRTG